jgi:hypothetical protein
MHEIYCPRCHTTENTHSETDRLQMRVCLDCRIEEFEDAQEQLAN